MSKGELLMIVHRIPYPPDKGDKIRSFNELKFLSEHGWKVHLCTLADDPDDMVHLEALKKYCASVWVEPLQPIAQKINSLGAPFLGLPMSARYFYNASLQRRVDEILTKHPIAAVFCFCSPMAEYLRRSTLLPLSNRQNGRTRFVMDLVDVDSDKWRQYAERSVPPMKWIYHLEAVLLQRYERQVAERFDATLLVSSAEVESFRQRTGAGKAVHAVSNGVDLDFFHTARADKSEGGYRISFCGAMSYRPNIDAVVWFSTEVLPRIRKALGEVEFSIVGGGAGAEVRALEALPGVRVTGRVDDVRQFVWNSHLSVAPIRIARGIQNKVLEAMAMGVATLVTPQAFEGLEVEEGRDVAVAAAQPEAFAAAVLELLRDSDKRRTLAQRARRAVEAKYSWGRRLEELELLLVSDTAEGPAAWAGAGAANADSAVVFSVIIPARNEELNIGRCLRSVSSVDWPSDQVEILLIDNGSSDRTVDMAREYGTRVFSRPGDTVAGLRNFGASQALGSILVFLDADCTVARDWFHQAQRYLQQTDVACFGSPPVIPEECTWVQRVWFHIRRKKGCVETDWLESMNMFVRGEAFEKVGGFNAGLVTCEDYDLSLRLRSCGRLVSDDRIVAVHHGEAASLGHFFRKEHWRALGNLRGMGSHCFSWRELPSVVLPLVYCLFAFATAAGLVAALFTWNSMLLYALAGILLVWQLPLYLLALWKISRSAGLVAASQLYLLINVYFFARGLASLRWRSLFSEKEAICAV